MHKLFDDAYTHLMGSPLFLSLSARAVASRADGSREGVVVVDDALAVTTLEPVEGAVGGTVTSRASEASSPQ